MKLNKKNIYITLFGILYGGVALVSLIHAVSFFALANLLWLAILLAVIFEIGQSAVLFSILTSSTGKSKVMPWTLMCILTAVQILGNVFSSYKYIVSNSPENLRFFKEPVFIWTDIPDAQATVIITYIVGGILPLVALAMSAMVTNYLEDENSKKNQPLIDQENLEGINKVIEEAPTAPIVLNNEQPLINQNSILNMENKSLHKTLEDKDKELEELKEKLNQTEENHDKMVDEKFEAEKKFDNLLEDYSDQNKEVYQLKQELDKLKEELKSKQKLIDLQDQEINELDKENQELVKEKFDKEPEKTINEENKDDISVEYIEQPNGQESDEGESEFEMDEQLQEEIINEELPEDKHNIEEIPENINNEDDERGEYKSDDNGEQSLGTTDEQTEETIPEDSQSDNEEQVEEEDPGVDENIKVADALMGGNILSKQRIKKDSHFINKP